MERYCRLSMDIEGLDARLQAEVRKGGVGQCRWAHRLRAGRQAVLSTFYQVVAQFQVFWHCSHIYELSSSPCEVTAASALCVRSVLPVLCCPSSCVLELWLAACTANLLP